MREIRVYRKGSFAPYIILVDEDNYEFLSRFNWRIIRRSFTLNHVATVIDGKTVYMHQLVLPCPNKTIQVEHANNNGLDNRRSNLRLSTQSQNMANKGSQDNNTSGYRGVSFHKRAKSWRAYITCKGVTQHLGLFRTSKEAAKAYNKAALTHFGEFAKINEVSDD